MGGQSQLHEGDTKMRRIVEVRKNERLALELPLSNLQRRKMTHGNTYTAAMAEL